MKHPLRPLVLLAASPLVLAACQESNAGIGDAQEERNGGMDATAARGVERAQAVLAPVGDSGVTGEIRFQKVDEGVRITGRIEGLEPGQHGFHVHQYGDLSDRQGGQSAGGHFSPDGSPHGRPSDEERHVGDLGNVEASQDGVATVEMVDDVIALGGENSILGRALVVHAAADEFVQPSGDAGDRVAFGVIGIAAPPDEGPDRDPAETDQ